MAKDADILIDAKERFRQSEDAESENRNGYIDDWRFARLGEQWPDKMRRERELEGRPCLTINKMPSFIRQVVNDARQNTPQIKVHPIDGQGDTQVADILSGMIRSIEVESNADAAYDTALDCAVTGGFGYFRIDVDYSAKDSFDLDVCVKRIVNPLTVYGDASSTAVDASDWGYGFVTELMKKTDFERKYKGAEKVDWQTYADGRDLDWFQENTVRIAEYWERNEVTAKLLKLNSGLIMMEDVYLKNKELFDVSGIQVVADRDTKSYKVVHRVMTGSEVLETKDWAGCYIPLCPVYGDEIVVEGRRYFYSLIRMAKDAQRMFNYWRSASTELVALAPKTPFIGPEGAFDVDVEKWTTANTKSHAFIQYSGQVPPQRQPFAGPPAGAIQEAMNASEDIKSILGLFNASLGAVSNETSGRAIIARQREGDVSTFHFIDNLARAITYAGKVMVDLIPKVYSSERMIRIIGPDDTNKPVQINTGMYDLNVGRYDVTVSTGPSFTTKREESSAQMVEFIKVFPGAAPIIGDVVAKNLDWPGADEIAKRLKAMLPPQLQQLEQSNLPPEAQALIGGLQNQLQLAGQQMQQMQQQLGEAMQQAQLAKLDSERQRVALADKSRDYAAEVEKARIAAESAQRVKILEGQQNEAEIRLKAYLEERMARLESMLTMRNDMVTATMHESSEPLDNSTS